MSSKRYGTGQDRIAQAVRSLVQDIQKSSTRVQYGTYVSDGVIRLDGDGYDLYADEGTFVLLWDVVCKPGDRILAVPILDGQRGTILVLGKTSRFAVAPHSIQTPVEIVQGGLPLAVSGGEFGDSDFRSSVFNRRMFYPGSALHLYGSTSGDGTVTITDGENGSLYSGSAGDDIDIELSAENIGVSLTNRVTVSLSVPAEQSGSIESLFISIESP